MKDEKGYYDIEIDFEKSLLEDGLLDSIFYLKDLKQRKLIINTEIEQGTIAEAVRHILQFNADDKGKEPQDRQPILLYLVSNGGDVDSGFELIDAIINSKTPVYTINLGYQYSMGFLIGLAGHKRYASQNAKYLMHDGSNFIYNSGAKAQDQMEFNKKVEERVRDYILSKTKIAPKVYDQRKRIEWYMFADEAKELGVTDYIIGVDCDIDEVI